MLKKYLLIVFSSLFITNLTFAWQPLPPEVIYTLSENQQYLLQIIPMSDRGNENIPYGIERNELTVIIYEKQSKNIEGVSETIYWGQEVFFFRVKHPDTVNGKSAEAIQGLISNDGKRIVIQSLVNPMAAISTINEIFIYEQSGKLLKGFSKSDIFNLKGTFSGERILSLKIDEKNYQLEIGSENGNKRINLKNMQVQ